MTAATGDFHSTRYTSWCPERKDIEQWASTVAAGENPRDCRFQPLTLLPEDEGEDACNAYGVEGLPKGEYACGEEDLEAYLESLQQANRWSELEASCAWMDKANIRIEELDLTDGLPGGLVLNQRLSADVASAVFQPSADVAPAVFYTSADVASALSQPSAASADLAFSANAELEQGKFSSSPSESSLSSRPIKHLNHHHPHKHSSLRSFSNSVLSHLGLSHHPHSTHPTSSHRPHSSSSCSSSPIRTHQNPRRASKDSLRRTSLQNSGEESERRRPPLHHSESFPLGSPQRGTQEGGVFMTDHPHAPYSPVTRPFASVPSSLNHTSSGTSSLKPGVVYSHSPGADIVDNGGVYSAKFDDFDDVISGSMMAGGNGQSSYSTRNPPAIGGSARFIAPRMHMHEHQHTNHHLPRQHRERATSGGDVSARTMSSVDSRTGGRSPKPSSSFLPELSPEGHLKTPLDKAPSGKTPGTLAHGNFFSISSGSSGSSSSDSCNDNESSSSGSSGGSCKKSGMHRFLTSLLEGDMQAKGRRRKIKVWMGDVPGA